MMVCGEYLCATTFVNDWCFDVESARSFAVVVRLAGLAPVTRTSALKGLVCD